MRFVQLLSMLLLAFSLNTEDLDDLLQDYVADDDPAVVLLVSTEDATWVGARGLADMKTGRAVRPDDRFRIGSITKTFVAAVVLQLQEEERLSLDDPISDYLPADVIDNIENAGQATVRQLLNMTSGIYSYTDSDAFADAVEDDPGHAWTALETVEFAYGEDAHFAPGEGYYYSNTNYNLLQLIIEEVTGNTLAEELQNRIFEPLEMKQTFLETQMGEGIVKGYSDLDGDGELDDVTLVNDGIGLGDGGIISTAADLARFPRGLFDLLNEDSLEEMLTYINDEEDGFYGLGISYTDGDFGDELGHDGATAGFQANMLYLPDEDVVVIVLSNNFDSEIIEDLTYAALNVVLEEE